MDTCWSKRAQGVKFHAWLCNEIRTKRSTRYILVSINTVIWKACMSAEDIRCFRRLVLFNATRLNHCHLVERLLYNSSYDLDSSIHCETPSPLNLAIQQGKVQLVEVFLNAGTSVTNRLCGNFESAVKFACLDNQLDIMRILVAYDRKQSLNR